MATRNSGKISRLEFHLSYECVQRCVFCSESGRMAKFVRSPVSLREVVAALSRERKAGLSHVTFTGGEPTLHPRLPQALRAARKLGYRTYVTSNGCRLREPEYARLALPLIDELCLSVHGDRAAVHDAVAGRAGSFAAVTAALRLVDAAERPPYLLINTVVARKNLGALGRTLRMLLKHGSVRHCLVSNVAPEGRALEDYKGLAVRLKDLRALAPGLARAAAKRGVTLRFFGVPPCALGRHRDLANDLHWSPRVTLERKPGGLARITSLRPDRFRAKTARCRACSLRRRCGGVFQAYLDLHGDRELTPVPGTCARQFC